MSDIGGILEGRGNVRGKGNGKGKACVDENVDGTGVRVARRKTRTPSSPRAPKAAATVGAFAGVYIPTRRQSISSSRQNSVSHLYFSAER